MNQVSGAVLYLQALLDVLSASESLGEIADALERALYLDCFDPELSAYCDALDQARDILEDALLHLDPQSEDEDDSVYLEDALADIREVLADALDSLRNLQPDLAKKRQAEILLAQAALAEAARRALDREGR